MLIKYKGTADDGWELSDFPYLACLLHGRRNCYLIWTCVLWLDCNICQRATVQRDDGEGG